MKKETRNKKKKERLTSFKGKTMCRILFNSYRMKKARRNNKKIYAILFDEFGFDKSTEENFSIREIKQYNCRISEEGLFIVNMFSTKTELFRILSSRNGLFPIYIDRPAPMKLRRRLMKGYE